MTNPNIPHFDDVMNLAQSPDDSEWLRITKDLGADFRHRIIRALMKQRNDALAKISELERQIDTLKHIVNNMQDDEAEETPVQ